MKISTPKSPQDISEEEADLGFQKLVLEGMEEEEDLLHFFQDPAPPAVVACILSSYEILLKILSLEGEVEYSHLQFGYFRIMGLRVPEDEPDWAPVHAPCNDAAMFLQEYGVGIHKTHTHPHAPFTPVKFRHRTA